MSKMRFVPIALALAGSFALWGAPAAQAQWIPPGSYLETCAYPRVEGDTLLARCRRADGSWARAGLTGIGTCTGDISNQNGYLTCNQGGGYGGYGPGPGPGPRPYYGYQR